MTGEKLRACPFCGREARFVPETPEGDCQVFCVGCEICFSARSIMAEDAIANWNTRSLPAALDLVIESAGQMNETYLSDETKRQLCRWLRALRAAQTPPETQGAAAPPRDTPEREGRS